MIQPQNYSDHQELPTQQVTFNRLVLRQALRCAIADVARDCDSPIMMELATRSLDRATASRIRRKTVNH